ncbi:MAG TPA: multifunctional 2',3'-cyclic-nucleotide 2'-phosphodiesterase/5'-nucleotidase/3'-nucleotidase, partial [Ruminiclostridium sp.]|nr:multifunctional 2',3'-cyclic-nucleotide 2'-phosphodiesterase/5'-nucleotidase/3'-nucleotidase [Ruminiclostridium sp.]
MKSRILSLILVFILVFSMTAFADETAAAPAKTIAIIHTNDVHSRVLEDSSGIGYAKVAALASDILSQSGTEPILVDAGDALHGQTIATLERGESIIKIMNTVGYDVMTPGNHDFNYGQDRLLELVGKAEFKIISANITKPDGAALLEGYTIIERNGAKIAFFGLSTPETSYKTNPKNVAGLTFADPVKAAENMVSVLRDKADVIVAVSHLGLDEASEITSRLVAEKVEGIDLIIDGHSHTVLNEPLKVNDTLIVQTGEYLKNVGTVQIELDENNKVTGIKAGLVTKEQSAGITAREDVVKAIDDYTEAQKSILSEVILKNEIE